MVDTSIYSNPLFAPIGGGSIFSNPFVVALDESAKTAVTGTQTDVNYSTSTLGKDIPVFVGGKALMGCRLYEGPFIYTVGGAEFVDIIVGCGVAASPEAVRTISSLRLNGTESATSGDGGATWSPIGSAFADLEISVKTGTEDQTPFASSIARYGDRAVPYRSHICCEIKKIPLAVFANVIPFVSLQIYEADYLPRNDALAKLARYARYVDSEFEFNVTGRDDFWIVAQQSTFIEYLQTLRRVYRNWNIAVSDKLRVFENDSAGGVDVTLTRSDFVGDTIRLRKVDALSIPRERAFSFIDTGRDNDINTVVGRRERFPMPLTASQSTETIELPIGMSDTQARADVYRSLLIDDIARTRLSGKVVPAKYGIEPGDVVQFTDDPNVNFLGRVVSCARNAADFTTDIEAERIDYFTFNSRPVIAGGATAALSVAEGETAVTTVTATDADGDFLLYSISGGADAALFSIDPVTGDLSFLLAPEFTTPLDADADNVYEVEVSVSDGALTDTQALSITILDVVRALTVVAGAGAYTMSGAAATVRYARKVAASAGAYALSGTAAALKKGRAVAAAAGAYALTGTAAAFKRSTVVVAGGGSYAMTGTAATMTIANPFVTFESGSVSNVTLSGGDLVASNTATTNTNQGAKVGSSAAKSSGKFYFEITLTSLPTGGNVGLGVGTYASTFANMGNSATTGTMCYPNTGSLWSNGSALGISLGGRATGDVIGVAVDLDNGKAYFKKVSGTPGNWNNNGSADPASNSGGVTMPAGSLVPFVVFGGGGGTNGSFTANFGQSSFTGSVPSGFTSGWSS